MPQTPRRATRQAVRSGRARRRAALAASAFVALQGIAALYFLGARYTQRLLADAWHSERALGMARGAMAQLIGPLAVDDAAG